MGTPYYPNQSAEDLEYEEANKKVNSILHKFWDSYSYIDTEDAHKQFIQFYQEKVISDDELTEPGKATKLLS